MLDEDRQREGVERGQEELRGGVEAEREGLAARTAKQPVGAERGDDYAEERDPALGRLGQQEHQEGRA